MNTRRGASQILYGFIPGQTVDVGGRIWKVREWTNPIRLSVDDSSLRDELVNRLVQWTKANLDDGFARNMKSGSPVQVVGVSKEDGVRLESFPDLWCCQVCQRVVPKGNRPCVCGSGKWKQLPFVGFHDACGAVDSPWIPRCTTHRQVRINNPQSSAIKDIRFTCPVCHVELQKGFGFRRCTFCKNGNISFNLHRAPSVFTQHYVVVINAATSDRVRELQAAGGTPAAVKWVMGGCVGSGPQRGIPTKAELTDQLGASGISPEVVAKMVLAAGEAGQLAAEGTSPIPDALRSEAESQARCITLALADTRVTLEELRGRAGSATELGRAYRHAYPMALKHTGLEKVELVTKFPVLTAAYGYTRGSSEPGQTQLVPFRDRGGQHVLYGDRNDTEALYFSLSGSQVCTWLGRLGFKVGNAANDLEARQILMHAMADPTEVGGLSAEGYIRRLIHTLCHRVIRRVSLYGGMDRGSLSEMLFPMHLSFFVFATSRGGFTLGGLQSVFETVLHVLLSDVASSDHRCPLDPGCQDSGGSCAACLHLGEHSCRWFNRDLDRGLLRGPLGFFDNIPQPSELKA